MSAEQLNELSRHGLVGALQMNVDVTDDIQRVDERDDTIQPVSQFHEEPAHRGLVRLSFFLHFRWSVDENDDARK